MPEYPDDDGIRTVNLDEGNLVQVLGHLMGPGGEYELGVQDIDAFVAYVSNLTGLGPGRLDNLFARLALVEAATGVGQGGTDLNNRITALSAQVADIRLTRYWSRPAEAVSSWTADFNKAAKDAAPLVLSTQASPNPFTVTTDGPGKAPAIRITGEGYITPIAKTHLDDGEVWELTYRQARRTNAGSGQSNFAVNEIACYGVTGAFISSAGLPSSDLLVAEGLRTVTYRVSLDPLLSSVALPAGTRFFSPLFGGRTGTGAIEITSVDRSSQSLSNAPEMTDPLASDDLVYIFDTSAKTVKKSSLLKLEAYLAPPIPNWFKGAKSASKSEQTLVAAASGGAIISNLMVQNTSRSAYIAVGVGGVSPSLTDGGSYVLGPGMPLFLKDMPPGRVAVISDTEGSPISCNFSSTVNLDPNSGDRASRHIARYGSAMSADKIAAIGTLYNALYDSGWLDLCGKAGALWIGSAPNNFDGLINWSGTNNFGRILQGDNNVYPETSFAGTLFNGLNAIDSLIKPPLALLPRHALFSWTDPTLKSAAKVSMGNTVLRLNPDRSNGADSVYTGAGSSIISGIPGYGGLKGYVRRDADNFRYYRNADYRQDVVKTVNEATGGAQSIAIGALNTSSGLQFGETTPMRMAAIVMDAVPTDDQVAKLYNALTAFHTALGA